MTSPINLFQAFLKIESGRAKCHIDAFIRDAKRSIITGNNEICIDDAVVAAEFLRKLAYKTAEGRKLLKLPKRKNYRKEYCAAAYSESSREIEIAKKFNRDELTREQAINELLDLHPGADENITLPRFLQDLSRRIDNYADEIEEIIDAADPEGLLSDEDAFNLALAKLLGTKE